MATDIIARGMITEYKSGTNIDFKENEDGSVTISASGDVSSEDTVARETIDNHKLDKNNPHNVTAEQVGLGNVNNTADLDKPISTAVQTALDKKVDKTDVQDNLESTDTTSPLSANQGRILNEKITEHTDNSDIHVTVTDKDNWNGYANEIEQNKTDISQLFDITKGGADVGGESSYTISNAVDYPLLGLNLYGKSTQDGVPTPDTPVDIVSVGDNGNINIMTDNNDDKSTTASITSALPLCGIPIESGGNYTDSNGQQWICDYVDFARGVKVQKLEKVDLSELSWTLTNNDNYKYWISYSIKDGKKVESYDVINNILAEKYIAGSWSKCVIKENFVKNQIAYTYPDGHAMACQNGSETEKPSGKFMYELATPIETPLSESELQAYRQLQTYNGVTNISNDGGADMDVEYCTNKMLSEYVFPITTGLQKQIDELQAAILSLGSNV